MKTSHMMTLLAVGALSMGTGAAFAASRAESKAVAPASQQAQGERFQQRLDAFRFSVTPTQRAGLMKAADGWKVMAKGTQDTLWVQVQKDVARIFTPAQAREFMGLVSPQLSYGGKYLTGLCLTSTATGVLFSVVGVVGCPDSAESNYGLFYSWSSFIYANVCMIEGAESCGTAVDAASISASNWAVMVETCDVADTAYYSMALAYAACGGTWE